MFQSREPGTRARSVTLFILAAVLSLAVHSPACGNFIDQEVGARPLAIGGAFVGVADDANAVVWNPAGLTQKISLEMTGMINRIYSVEGLRSDYFAISKTVKAGKMGLGFAWMRTGVTDVYNEDNILLSVAHQLGNTGLSAGITLKRFSVAAPGYEYYNDPNFKGQDDCWSADASLFYRRGNTRVGLSVKNIVEPELTLISSTVAPDRVPRELAVGASYVFRNTMLLSGEMRRKSFVPSYYDSRFTFHAGAEAWFFDVFALRTGVDAGRPTVGWGLFVDPVSVDISLLSTRRIGNVYRLSASLRF
ncbi:MAG: type IX secretion system membrane protein PorP/SprF [Candidatus Eiseniibacteriota bacterium]|nr:MAG: type IX secretion system membrane protein PorP/SprF [Candidatus Eisenbacteria bacterium]